jgi:NCS1 family nucleobase:cation symporter-1
MVLNGTIGARLHVSFPVLNRSSFGFWFSYFSVLSRVVLSMFWFAVQVRLFLLDLVKSGKLIAVQTFNGSECVYQMLKAIWPSVAHVPNHLPESSHITSVGS